MQVAAPNALTPVASRRIQVRPASRARPRRARARRMRARPRRPTPARPPPCPPAPLPPPRPQSELRDFTRNPPDGCALEACEPITSWHIRMDGPEAAPGMPAFYEGALAHAPMTAHARGRGPRTCGARALSSARAGLRARPRPGRRRLPAKQQPRPPGEVYRLQVKFTERYPLEPPEVMFVPPHTPVHPHVYSNGHICLGARRRALGPAACAVVCLRARPRAPPRWGQGHAPQAPPPPASPPPPPAPPSAPPRAQTFCMTATTAGGRPR